MVLKYCRIPELMISPEQTQDASVTRNQEVSPENPGNLSHQTPPITKVIRKYARKHLNMEEISKCFHLPFEQACDKLGVGETVLRRRFKKLGIKRWPYLKLKCLNSLVNSIQDLGTSSSTSLREELPMLKREQQRIEENPLLLLELDVKKFKHMVNSKGYYRRKLKKDALATATSTGGEEKQKGKKKSKSISDDTFESN